MESGDGHVPSATDRALWIALRAGLLSVAALVVYVWMLRASSDLTWDEAFNLRVYSRHPLTAIAVYDEHNNHPLESFLKSLFVVTLGTRPPMLRITAFLFVVAHLALAWALFRGLARRGAVLAGTLLGLSMLLARGISYQAMELRGYFLSSVLELSWFFLLARETDLLRAPDSPLPPKAPRWTFRTAVRYGLLAGLIVFTLPSNVLVLPALGVLTIAAFRQPVEEGLIDGVRRGVQLAAAAIACAVLLYAPIVAAQLLGFSKFHNSEARPVHDVFAAIVNEVALAGRQLAPRGASETLFGWGVLGLAAVAAAFAFLPRTRLVRLGLLVAATALLARIAFAAFVAYPERTRTAQVVPLAIALVLAVQGLAATWSRRAQTIAAIALVALSFGAAPELVAEAGPYRAPTEVASFLEIVTRPESREVLIVHDHLRDPLWTVGRTFGEARVVSSRSELDARVRGETIAGRLPPGTWKSRLRDALFPATAPPPIDLGKVEVLVLLEDEGRAGGATGWSHAGLDEVRARLARRSEFHRAGFRLVIFEAPAGR